jgi:hypothetical protein
VINTIPSINPQELRKNAFGVQKKPSAITLIDFRTDRNWFVYTDLGFALVFTTEATIKVIADGFFVNKSPGTAEKCVRRPEETIGDHFDRCFGSKHKGKGFYLCSHCRHGASRLHHNTFVPAAVFPY